MSSEPDELTALWDRLAPYMEKAMTSPQGMGLIMVLAGAFVKQTQADYWIRDPSFAGPPNPIGSQSTYGMKHITSDGLNWVVLKVDTTFWTQLSTNTNPNDPVWNWIKSALSIPDATVGSPSFLSLRLGDVLIAMGLGCVFGSSAFALLKP